MLNSPDCCFPSPTSDKLSQLNKHHRKSWWGLTRWRGSWQTLLSSRRCHVPSWRGIFLPSVFVRISVWSVCTCWNILTYFQRTTVTTKHHDCVKYDLFLLLLLCQQIEKENTVMRDLLNNKNVRNLTCANEVLRQKSVFKQVMCCVQK